MYEKDRSLIIHHAAPLRDWRINTYIYIGMYKMNRRNVCTYFQFFINSLLPQQNLNERKLKKKNENDIQYIKKSCGRNFTESAFNKVYSILFKNFEGGRRRKFKHLVVQKCIIYISQ